MASALCLHVSLVWAQAPRPGVIQGQVVDAETGRPLEGVHVFVAASMIGTATGSGGRFILEDVPAGAHRLYVSRIGYEHARQDVRIWDGDEHNLILRLRPAVVSIPEVTVTAERNRRWERRFQRFQRLFLGGTPNAEHTVIENPQVLDFRGGLGWLEAHAAEPLVVVNRALGYRIRYFLKEFRSSGDGSFHHFMLAALAGRAEEEGFTTYRRPSTGGFALDPQRLHLSTEQIFEQATDSTVMLDFWGVVEVAYGNEPEDPAFYESQGRRGNVTGVQTSYFWLSDGPTEVDHTGEVIDPYGVTVSGYFGFERIADELPKEYRPDKEDFP